MVKTEKSVPRGVSDVDRDDVENLPPGTRVWAYLRHSPGDDQTLESQEDAVRRHIREKGWVLDRLFKDRWASGSSTTGREEFQLMVHLARQDPRPADVLVIWKFARFARNQIHSQLYRSRLRVDGWKIHSMMDDIPSGPIGTLYEAMLDWMNEQVLMDLKADTIRGLVFVAEMGCLPTGRPCKGYRIRGIEIGTKRDGSPRMGRKLDVDPEFEGRIVKAFELKASGASQPAIAKQTGLYATNPASLIKMFRNRAYVGEYEMQGKVYTSVYPAIVSRELFNAVQSKLPKARPPMKGRHHPRRKGSTFFLANIAVCAHCGARMEGKSVKKYRYYVCEHRNENVDLCPDSGLVPADDVEREVLDALKNHVLAPERLQELLEWTNDALSSGWEDLRLQVKKTEKELSDAASLAQKMAYNYGTMDRMPKSAEARLHQQDKLVDDLRARLAELEWEVANSRIEASLEQVEEYVERARATIESGEFFDLREICEQVCSRIVVSREECRVEVHFPVDSMPVEAGQLAL